MAASKTKSLVNVAQLDEQFGEFAVADYSESIYPALYYALREVMGIKCQAAMRQQDKRFDWKAFNAKFIEVMGGTKVEERKYTLEQLIQYATTKTGKGVEDLLEINRKSWERRNNQKGKNNGSNQEEMVEDEF